MKLNSKTKNNLRIGDGLKINNEVMMIVSLWHCGNSTYITLADSYHRNIYGSPVSLFYGAEMFKNIEKPYRINE